MNAEDTQTETEDFAFREQSWRKMARPLEARMKYG